MPSAGIEKDEDFAKALPHVKNHFLIGEASKEVYLFNSQTPMTPQGTPNKNSSGRVNHDFFFNVQEGKTYTPKKQ